MRSRPTVVSIIFLVAVTAADARRALAQPAMIGPAITAVESPLFERPGEASRQVARLARGTRVEIVGQDGRWVEARAGGVRGWLPRSAVERPGRAVWIGPALVRVARAGVARAEPDPATPAVFEVDAGAALRASGERRRGWILVENADGVVGWLSPAMVRASPAPRERHRATAAVRSAANPGSGRAARFLARPKWIRARAGLGVSSLSMDFSSDGSSPLSAYRVSASAMAALTSIEVGMAAGRVRGAVDGSYGVNLGMPGIRYHEDETGQLDPVGFVWHHFDAGARLGYLIGQAIAPFLRAGVHFDWFRVDDVTNPGSLGREGLRGITVGAGVEGAVSDELLVRAGGDALVGGGRKQTPGLEDGLRNDALAAWGRLEASYLASESLAIEGAYQYRWASTEWSGQSPRQPDVTDALRTDRSHLLLLTVLHQF